MVRLRPLTLLTPATYSAVPFDPELEVLIRIESLCVDAELSHEFSFSRFRFVRPSAGLDDDELGRLQRREADDDVDNAQVDIVLRGGFLVALDEVGILRRLALERALAEKPVHERADVQANLRPQRLVVRLEDHPLRAAIEALLDEQSGAPDGDVFPLGGELVVRRASVRAPHDDAARGGHRAKAVDAERVQLTVFIVGQWDAQLRDAVTRSASSPAGAFQTPRSVSVRRKDSCDGTARDEIFQLVVSQWIRLREPRERTGSVLAVGAYIRDPITSRSLVVQSLRESTSSIARRLSLKICRGIAN